MVETDRGIETTVRFCWPELAAGLPASGHTSFAKAAFDAFPLSGRTVAGQILRFSSLASMIVRAPAEMRHFGGLLQASNESYWLNGDGRWIDRVS